MGKENKNTQMPDIASDAKTSDVVTNSSEYRIAAIYGSPRRGGNTDLLLNRFIDGIAECSIFKDGTLRPRVDRIIVSGLGISPCRECRHCSMDGNCIIKDKMQDIYPIIIESNLILVASPVFFTTVYGYLKSFIDRFQRFWALKYELKRKIISAENKKGMLFSCAGSKQENIFDCTKKVMRSFFDVLYTDYYDDFCYNNIDFKGDISKNHEILKEVYEYARKGKFINNA